MADFDGSEFVGLDADFFGDGETDDTTQPLSVYKEQRIDGNNRYLRTFPDKCCQTYGYRPNSSTNRGFTVAGEPLVVWWKPVRIMPSHESILLRVNAIIDLDGQTEGSFEVQLHLWAWQEGAGLAELISSDKEEWEGNGGDNEEYEIELDIPRREFNVQGGTEAVVGLSILSTNNTLADRDNGAFEDGFASGEDWELTPGAIKNESQQGTTFTGVRDDEYIEVRGDGDTEREPYDIVGEGSTWIYTHPPLSHDGTWDDVVQSLDVNYGSTWWGCGYELELHSSDDVTVNTYVPKDDSEMQAQDPVLGMFTSKHGSNFNDTYSIPRPVLFGPERAEAPTTEEVEEPAWEKGVYQVWDAKEIELQNTTEFRPLSLKPSSMWSEIEIELWYMVTYGGIKSGERRMSVYRKNNEEDSPKELTGRWDVELSQCGAEVTVDEDSVERTDIAYIPFQSGSYLFYLQEYFRWWAFGNQGGMEAPGYTKYEGMVSENDFQLMNRETFLLRPEETDWENVPLRLNINWTTNDIDGEKQSNDHRFKVTLVGVTATETRVFED